MSQRKLVMSLILDTVNAQRGAIILFLAINVFDFAIFSLYRLPLEPCVYALILSCTLLLIILTIHFVKVYQKQKEMQLFVKSIEAEISSLPEPNNMLEGQYQEAIALLLEKLEQSAVNHAKERREKEDYYAVWVHQIKTPISVMRLKLDETQTDLSIELFRIEQYVDMALSYIRLNSDSNDLVIREYDLDEIIKETLRKYASLFITRKIKLEYQEVHQTLVTDKKWFGCILEQLISNAVKYTQNGGVSVYVEGDTLCIKDTGIGIKKEDLPRIFEKGYTGINGREEVKSSGLGLYLSKKIADMLGLTLTVQSELGEGSAFCVGFHKTSP